MNSLKSVKDVWRKYNFAGLSNICCTDERLSINTCFDVCHLRGRIGKLL